MEWIATWQAWTILLVLMLIVSASIGDITLIAVALAAAGAATAAHLDYGIYAQLGIFAVISSILGPVFYFLFRSDQHHKEIENIGSGAASGMETVVTTYNDKPSVQIDNQFYPAKREDNQPLHDGDKVIIQRMSGITAIVRVTD